MKNNSKKFTKKIISGKFKGKILKLPQLQEVQKQ